MSFKKIVDVNELKGKFVDANIPVDPDSNEDIASILLCFGNIDVEKCWGDRVPPETPEENKARANLKAREEKLIELQSQREKDIKQKKIVSRDEEKKRNEEEAKILEDINMFKAQLKPKKPQKIKLSLTSLHDLI